VSARVAVLVAAAVLTAACTGALVLARRMGDGEKAQPGDVVMMLALGLGCGFYALLAWGWLLFEVVTR
jgi:hypothetical protein